MDRTTVEMPANKVWAGRAPEGGCLRIACVSGTLWVTAEGAEDHILSPGGSFRTSEPVLVVVEALEDSEVQVTAMGRKASPWRRLFQLSAGGRERAFSGRINF